MKYDSDTFARGLRVQMAINNLSTTELSCLTGISRTTITSLKSGTSKGVQFKTLDNLCRTLNCTLDLLFIEE